MSSSNHDLAVRMAELARSLAMPRSIKDLLADVTAAAKELIPGVDEAGVLLIGKGETFETLGPTSGLMAKLDELQMRYLEGPCVKAALDEVVVRTDDFRDEPRWPNYSPQVVELGVLSGLSFKLYTADRTAGALNLFGFEPRLWDAEAETIGMVLAAHAAAAHPGEPGRRAAAVRVVDAGPHRAGQGHHHGAVRHRRHPRVRHAASAVAGHQHQARRHRATRDRHPRDLISTAGFRWSPAGNPDA